MHNEEDHLAFGACICMCEDCYSAVDNPPCICVDCTCKQETPTEEKETTS